MDISLLNSAMTTHPGLCFTGHYCPEGTVEPIDCPPGTYGAVTGLTNVTGCTPCDLGQYCQTPALTAPEGDCHAGFYCEEASDNPTPVLCPPGHYCPPGTGVPFRCPEVCT